VLRGFSLGLVGQPLILAALATIRPRLLTQASSLSTVVRSVASSLGIAVLATVVQTQTQVHYAHLAEQVTPASTLGQMVSRIQAYLVAGGTSMANARTTALQLIAELVQQQSYDLAIRDAFLLTLAFVFLSVIATLSYRANGRCWKALPRRLSNSPAKQVNLRREQSRKKPHWLASNVDYHKLKEHTMLRRMILVPLLIVLAVLAIGGGVGYWIYNNYEYYTTDDAQVTGQLVNVSAVATGSLSTLSVKVGDAVTAGQSIASVTPVTASTTAVPAPISVTSPITGSVVQVYAAQGQAVSPGLPIVEVANLSNLTITAYVDESAINNVGNGQAVDITVDAYSGTSFSGHVQQIVQSAASEFSLLPTEDNASGNFTKVSQRIPVIITLDGTGGKDLVPGMSAEVTIHLH
jgi:hypothetical protein